MSVARTERKISAGGSAGLRCKGQTEGVALSSRNGQRQGQATDGKPSAGDGAGIYDQTTGCGVGQSFHLSLALADLDGSEICARRVSHDSAALGRWCGRGRV